MKKVSLIFVLIALLTWSVFFAPMPIEIVHAAGNEFVDVAKDYWGKQFISFAADSNIIKGYALADGRYQFKPENPVTREESMQMVYQAVKNSGMRPSPIEGLSQKYEQILTTHSIAPWAWECVAYGLEYGILENDELNGFRTDAGASVSATREQVARWTAKAIDRRLMPATSLQYTDKDQITAGNEVYIDLLNRMNIMVGDNLGKFNPKSSIKRVEFAVICTRVYQLASSSYDLQQENRSYQGTITGVNATTGKIFMTLADGSAKVIEVQDKVQIVIDGEVAYNGLSKLQGSPKAIVAWGPFQQIHITTKVLLAEGTINQLNALSDTCTEIALRLSGGSIVYYFVDRETSIIDELQKGQDVIFIADGVKIIEIANQ
jgi:hypothetical protein